MSVSSAAPSVSSPPPPSGPSTLSKARGIADVVPQALLLPESKKYVLVMSGWRHSRRGARRTLMLWLAGLPHPQRTDPVYDLIIRSYFVSMSSCLDVIAPHYTIQYTVTRAEGGWWTWKSKQTYDAP